MLGRGLVVGARRRRGARPSQLIRAVSPPGDTRSLTLIRIVYEFGLEATRQPDGWVVSSAEPSARRVFANPAAVTEALGRLPCLVTERTDRGHERSLLLRADARTPFGLGVTDLFTGDLQADAIFHAHHIAYLVGAVAYHCERLAEVYATICRQFVSVPWPDAGSDRVIFSYQTEPYYEFDAAITAARRAYDVSRYLIWQRFGSGGSVPSSLAKALQACAGLPDPLRLRLEKSWTEFGERITDYRDCIQHYVPIDFGLSSADMEKLAGGFWSVRIRIPDNPEVRSKKAFTYAQGLDALSYCRLVGEELVTVMTMVIDSSARPLSATD